jgi:hypothetical protein
VDTTEKIRRLTEELVAISKWDGFLGGGDDPVGKEVRLQRLWEIIVELGKASVKTAQD